MDLGLRDRTVLVTGSSSNIGAAIAVAYGREGARVIVTYHGRRDAAERVAAEVEAAGGRARVARYALGEPETAERIVAGHGPVDVLVGNAVHWGADAPPDGRTRFEDVPVDKWREMLDANVAGTAATVRAVLPGMRERGFGRIVLLSSGAAEEGVPGPGPYGPAKAALHGMARALAWDGGPDGILVNVVAAGFTPPPDHPFPPQLLDAVAARTPTRRLSTAADVARLVVFLGSPGNTNLTGEIVRDGTNAGRSSHVMTG